MAIRPIKTSFLYDLLTGKITLDLERIAKLTEYLWVGGDEPGNQRAGATSYFASGNFQLMPLDNNTKKWQSTTRFIGWAQTGTTSFTLTLYDEEDNIEASAQLTGVDTTQSPREVNITLKDGLKINGYILIVGDNGAARWKNANTIWTLLDA